MFHIGKEQKSGDVLVTSRVVTKPARRKWKSRSTDLESRGEHKEHIFGYHSRYSEVYMQEPINSQVYENVNAFRTRQIPNANKCSLHQVISCMQFTIKFSVNQSCVKKRKSTALNEWLRLHNNLSGVRDER